jgi:hypothetical protein
MKNISSKICRENQNTHFVFNKFFSPENRAVYEIMWDNIVVHDRPQVTIWRMRFACSVAKATDADLELVILIAFALQKWFHERVPMLYYTYVVFFMLTLKKVG